MAKKLWDLIHGIKIAMLTTEDSAGVLRSRPMATQQAEFEGDLWFFTGASSKKVEEAAQHREVNLAYSDPGSNRYVSVSGIAFTVRDPEKAKELWNPLYKAWFPQGLDDPNLALLKVEVHRAEYWDSPSSTMVQLVGFLKAVASGQTYQPGPGEHGTIGQ